MTTLEKLNAITAALTLSNLTPEESALLKEYAKDIEEELKVNNILQYLFIDRNKYDCPYYDTDAGICVDTRMTATNEEQQLVEEWVEKHRKDLENN